MFKTLITPLFQIFKAEKTFSLHSATPVISAPDSNSHASTQPMHTDHTQIPLALQSQYIRTLHTDTCCEAITQHALSDLAKPFLFYFFIFFFFLIVLAAYCDSCSGVVAYFLVPPILLQFADRTTLCLFLILFLPSGFVWLRSGNLRVSLRASDSKWLTSEFPCWHVKEVRKRSLHFNITDSSTFKVVPQHWI